MRSTLRRRLLTVLSLVLFVLVGLRFAGVVSVPARWIIAGWILDIALGLFEIAVAVVAGRAFIRGARRGGVLTGYEDWIEAEQELGMPAPLVWLARLELRFYRALGRLLRRS